MKRRISLIVLIVFVLTLLLSACGEVMPPPIKPTETIPDPEDERKSGVFEGELNGYSYQYFVPTKIKEKSEIPLLVMMHGSYQNANKLMLATNMNEYAEKYKFMVLYIDQRLDINSSGAFSWYDPLNQERGTSEIRLLELLVNSVITTKNVNKDSIYIAGFGEGASMAVNLAICYPEIFSGVASVAGVMYAASTSYNEAANVYKNGGIDPTKQGKLAYERMPEAYRKKLKVMVFHGEKDAFINSRNAQQIIISMAELNDLVDDGEDNGTVSDVENKRVQFTVDNGYAYTVFDYLDSTRKVLMKKYSVASLAHAWSEPNAKGDYTDVKGVNMSEEIAKFFFVTI